MLPLLLCLLGGDIERHLSFSRQKIENILLVFSLCGMLQLNKYEGVIASKHFTEDDVQQVAKYNRNPNKAKILIKLWYGTVQISLWISIRKIFNYRFYGIMKLSGQSGWVLFTRVFSVEAECRINSRDLAALELQFLYFRRLAVSLRQSHLNGVQEWKTINDQHCKQGSQPLWLDNRCE